MEGYVASEQLRFAGASGVNRGFEATMARYRKAYPGKSGMGELPSGLYYALAQLAMGWARSRARANLAPTPNLCAVGATFTVALAQPCGNRLPKLAS